VQCYTVASGGTPMTSNIHILRGHRLRQSTRPIQLLLTCHPKTWACKQGLLQLSCNPLSQCGWQTGRGRTQSVWMNEDKLHFMLPVVVTPGVS
jgi:hypothetical protein